MPNALIVTVTKVEAQAVLQLFSEMSGVSWQREFIAGKTYYAVGEIGGTDIFMVQSEMGAVGLGASLQTVHRAIEVLDPKIIIMVGIAFGVDSTKQQIGDVLVARQIQSYEPQKRKGKRFVSRGSKVDVSPFLLDKFRSGDLDWDCHDAKVHFGLILSGEKLINSLAFRDQLLASEPDAIGGEMEGAGLYAAAAAAKVDWILVKAICDWADGHKDDKSQSLAAHNAASFVLHVIKQGGLVDPTPKEIGSIESQSSYSGTLVCPYRGLLAFREEDAPIYFGRDAFSDRLIEAVRERNMVVVLGPSGSGKSSVVFAGLVPHLRKNGDWIVAHFRPGMRPFDELACALMPMLEPEKSETDWLIESKRLANVISQSELDLSRIIKRILHKNQNASQLLLIIDQFEELFSLCPEPKIRHRFLEVLLASLQIGRTAPRPPLTMLLCLRADFLEQALAYRQFADALQNTDEKLGPMTKAELRDAIEKPALVQRMMFEPGLVERIVADVENEPGALPLLEFTLAELWRRQVRHLLTHNAYEEIGQVAGALARYADGVYDNLQPDEQRQARRILIQMVKPGEGTKDSRRVAARADIGEEDWPLVQKLASARLLVTKEGDTPNKEVAEVVHEALIHRWKKLKGWMEDDRSFRAWQERLRVVLHQWESFDQDEGALLRGALLVEAERWLTERGRDLSENEKKFIAASLSLRIRNETREKAFGRLMHEFKVPLVAIRGAADFMLRPNFWATNATFQTP